MHQHGGHVAQSQLESDESARKILLVGQPNVGKSVLFSLLTGMYVTVSNYPGTTVEVMSGKFGSTGRLVIDTPGVGSIVPRSEDEVVALRYVLSKNIDAIVHVGDAKNLRRTLMLTVALAEAGLPMVLDLNMADEAERKGYRIDTEALSAHLGIPVVLTAATERRGERELREAIDHARVPSVTLAYPTEIEEAVERMVPHLPRTDARPRFLALTLLAGNLSMVDTLLSDEPDENRRALKHIILETQTRFSEPLSQVIMATRAAFVERLVREVVLRQEGKAGVLRFLSDVEDVSTHPVYGFIVLAFVLGVLYEVVGRFAAGTLVDALSGLYEATVVPVARALASIIPWAVVRDFFVGPYGQITMGLSYALAIVFPIIIAFFLVFSILEDSGYLPRLGVMLNRSFSRMGLNGKAVVPMVLGLGCGTMAALVTRVLETRRERVIATLLLALGIPCSAQLGVVLGVFGMLGLRALLLFFVLLFVQMLVVGYLAARVLPGSSAAFVTELPPYRFPKLQNIAAKTYFRAKWYLKEAVPMFLIGTAFLFFADLTGVLGVIKSVAEPLVVGWLNLPSKAAEAFILGFLRRDYGAAGLYALFESGAMDRVQTFVAMMTITLFVPCLANMLVIIKERGARVAAAIVSFVFFYAFLAGGLINLALRAANIRF